MKLAFEREHLAELRALGLLPQEVESLQRALPALAELLLPPVAMDARRDVLKNLHAALSTAETLVAKKIGRAHVWTPVTNAHLVCRLLLEKKKQQQHDILIIISINLAIQPNNIIVIIEPL